MLLSEKKTTADDLNYSIRPMTSCEQNISPSPNLTMSQRPDIFFTDPRIQLFPSTEQIMSVPKNN